MNAETKGPSAGLGGQIRPSAGAPGTFSVLLAPLTWAERAILLVGIAAIARCAVATTTGLSDTEAYYLGWSKVPALSYYDHPPLVAWTTWLFAHLGAGSEAARLGPLLYATAFDALVYRLTARLFSPRAAFYAVAVVTAMPVFFFTGFLLNPEALLAPLWLLFLLLLLDLREHDEPWRPPAVGAVLGVAFLAKYTAVLAVPVALLFVAGAPDARRWLRRPSFYLAGVVALAIASPVVVWNAQRHWPSLQLHLSERMSRAAGETLPHALERVAVAQFVYFQEIILPALLGVLAYALAKARRDLRYRFLVTASVPVLGFLLVVMVRASDSEPHWTMMGYVPLAIAAGGVLDESAGRLASISRGVFRAAMVLGVVTGVVFVVHLRSPVLAKALPSYQANIDPISETIGWDRVGEAVRDHAAKLGPRAVAAGAHNVVCGHLQVVLDDAPHVYCPSPRRTEFDFLGRRSPPPDAPVVFLDSERYPANLAETLPGHDCGPAERLAIDREGLPIGTYRVRDCAPRTGGAP